MKASEWREKTDEELRQERADARQEMFNLRMQSVAGQLEKPSRIRDLRKDIARIETILTERNGASQ